VRKLPEIVTEKKDKDKDREKEKERPRGRQLNNSEQHDKPQHRSGSREYGAYIIRLTPTLTKKKKSPLIAVVTAAQRIALSATRQ
jgi:hypothetical protein